MRFSSALNTAVVAVTSVQPMSGMRTVWHCGGSVASVARAPLIAAMNATLASATARAQRGHAGPRVTATKGSDSTDAIPAPRRIRPQT